MEPVDTCARLPIGVRDDTWCVPPSQDEPYCGTLFNKLFDKASQSRAKTAHLFMLYFFADWMFSSTDKTATIAQLIPGNSCQLFLWQYDMTTDWSCHTWTGWKRFWLGIFQVWEFRLEILIIPLLCKECLSSWNMSCLYIPAMDQMPLVLTQKVNFNLLHSPDVRQDLKVSPS